ncbi:MAG: YihY/virulence factor BrkB family protein [Clostridiales bacterium]|jgi:uncharacterized BrkB/YihY/UPF0761 family membrane protein|nr:YihY/virulence factor BrkB family protein [Clostridiales bacterium]
MRIFIERCREDDIWGMAAKCSYYMLFSFFPLALFTLSVFAGADFLTDTNVLELTLPQFVREMINDVSVAVPQREITVISLVLLAWSVYKSIRALRAGTRKIYQRKISGREVFLGCIITAFGWVLATWGFELYMKLFNNYSALYGQIGLVLGLALWLYVIALIVFISSEVNKNFQKSLHSKQKHDILS